MEKPVIKTENIKIGKPIDNFALGKAKETSNGATAPKMNQAPTNLGKVKSEKKVAHRNVPGVNSIREKIVKQGFAPNHTAEIEKLTKAGFDSNSSGGGYGKNNPSHIPQKRNTIHFNDEPLDGEGKYIANIGGQDFHYNDLDTAIDRAGYRSGKSPYEGSRTYDQQTKKWRFPNENEIWDNKSNSYVPKQDLGKANSNQMSESEERAKASELYGIDLNKEQKGLNDDVRQLYPHSRKWREPWGGK